MNQPIDESGRALENEKEKSITLSKNESLYLNDSLTLLLEHPTNLQVMSIPVRGIQGNAGFAAHEELILKLGEAILEVTRPGNDAGFVDISLSIEELFLIRECCQSYILFNDEPVGYNLMKKVYKALLGEHIEEKKQFDNLLSDVNMSPSIKKKSKGEEINDSNRTSSND